jgi:hypothetical protein
MAMCNTIIGLVEFTAEVLVFPMSLDCVKYLRYKNTIRINGNARQRPARATKRKGTAVRVNSMKAYGVKVWQRPVEM